MHSPLHAQIVQWLVQPGQAVARGDLLLIVEAMKMEHEIRAEVGGVLGPHFFVAGESVEDGVLLSNIERSTQDIQGLEGKTEDKVGEGGDSADRADLQRWRTRLAFTQDAARPDAVAKRHALGMRTARENIAALVDTGSFVEYGALAVAAQRSRRSEEDLIANTPADGMVCGIGTVHGQRTVVMAYDATVLAGTQGMRNHQKTDRMLGLALQHRLPVVLLAEGGGGRPGDVDMPIVAGLHVTTFASFARLNGRVPVVGIAAGRCFAGNAALLGCCDVVIATKNSNIGMGGPAMVEGGGLGVFRPEDIGPAAVQHGKGVIDVLVDDEAQAVAAARQYLGYFQSAPTGWQAPDAAALRAVVPENRLRVYDTRLAIEGIADTGSVLYLRMGFGLGLHTALVRIEGRPVGVLANNPAHLGGAIDADAADKAARFLQLCNAHGLPVVSLVDTPGFMVGPATEETAQVRHVSRMFIAAAHLRVPYVSVVLRKGYGLGAMAMTAGGFHAPLATAAWPSAEFGAMGLEGAVRLGYRKELEALPQGPQRQAWFDELLARHVEAGSALNMATTLEIDTVIDPADTRAWLAATLSAGRVEPHDGFGAIDTW
ncbi:carboxyl transferase domain-containing protein [Curvibacter sp. APW13]|uniref:carboxyl transferase domain-containing protein n=1 Tax=Curvibacter sp. APW13 TaxID=3077236 RepID=UPI0028DDB2B4|nr:carboxyl transferase domain-containing protein [Curvibacter sp. APW13]MDT8990789.1 carboxyl transferase domain-containing protein [Curvibacter sp. APW13]